jgi:hypothetical protein
LINFTLLIALSAEALDCWADNSKLHL